jgi:hypothetical protein
MKTLYLALLFALCGCAGAATAPGGSDVPPTDPSPSRVALAAPGVPVVGGCQVFPANNLWNADVSNFPLDPKSAQYIASIQNDGYGQTKLHPDFGENPTYGIPFVIVPSTQPRVPVSFAGGYPAQSDPGPYPIPPNAPVEGGKNACCDRHVLVLQSGTCELFEMYHAHEINSGASWKADAGAIFHLNSNKLRPNGWTSTDAAGLPILPGLVKCAEVQAGAIDHAIRFTVNRTANGYIHPATHASGTGGIVPMGLRLRMKASYDISHLHGQAYIIAVAMKKYGLMVADDGYNWYFQGEGTGNNRSSCWNDNELDQLKNVPGTAFEVVQTGHILHIGL